MKSIIKTQSNRSKPEMSSILLKEYSERIGNVYFVNDFELFTEEQKKTIARAKRVLEQKIGKELSLLNDKRLRENKSNFRTQKTRVLAEMARYERVCILEAISDNTANQMAEQAKGILASLAVFGELSPEINNAARQKSKSLMMNLETLQDMASVKGLGGEAKKYLDEAKKLFTDLVSMFKACDAVGEAYLEDDGKINQDILRQIFDWTGRSGKSQLLNSPNTLESLFEAYDEAVPTGEAPVKKGWFGSKLFGKKKPESGTQSTAQKFSKKVEEVIKEKSPASISFAPGLASSMLGESFFDVARTVNRFNSVVSSQVDIDLLNKLSMTSWGSAIKSFFSSAGGATSGSGLTVF